jgi:hypothetical protein
VAENHVNLPGFFQNEIAKLGSDNTGLMEIMTISGQDETLFIKRPDWETELQPFLESDLNHKSLSGVLTVDTFHTTTGTVLKYYSRDSTRRTMKGYIRMKNQSPDSVSLIFSSSSLYGNERKLLDYGPVNGYTISLSTYSIGGKKVDVTIKGLFKN